MKNHWAIVLALLWGAGAWADSGTLEGELSAQSSKDWMIEMGSTVNFENNRTTSFVGPAVSYRLDNSLFTGLRAIFSVNDQVQPSRQYLQLFSRHYLTGSDGAARLYIEPALNMGLRKDSTVAVSGAVGIQHHFSRRRFSMQLAGGIFWAFNSSFGGGDLSPMLVTGANYHF